MSHTVRSIVAPDSTILSVEGDGKSPDSVGHGINTVAKSMDKGFRLDRRTPTPYFSTKFVPKHLDDAQHPSLVLPRVWGWYPDGTPRSLVSILLSSYSQHGLGSSVAISRALGAVTGVSGYIQTHRVYVSHADGSQLCGAALKIPRTFCRQIPHFFSVCDAFAHTHLKQI